MQTDGVSTFVHDERPLASLQRELPLLRLAVGKPTPQLSSGPYGALKKELLGLPAEMDAFCRSRADDGWNLAALPTPASPFLTSAPLSTWSGQEAKGGSGAPWDGMDFHGYGDLEERVGPVLAGRAEPELREMFEGFRCSVAGATKDAQQRVDYHCLFAPSLERFAKSHPALLMRFFRDMSLVLDSGFGNLGFHASAVWDVLRDPDPYYLRLRGEVHELGRVRPDVPWLNYLFLLPDLFRLHARLLSDGRVAPCSKRHCLAALTYLLLPLDFLPESSLGTPGYVEDVFLLSKALRDLIESHAVSEGLMREHWSGGAERLDRTLLLAQQMRDHLTFFGRLGEWFALDDPR